MRKKKEEAIITHVAAHDIFGQFRFFKKDNGEIWWVAVDVCKTLGIKNHRDAVSNLDDDEKDCVGNTDAIGRIRQTLIVNESGLYHLIFMSRKLEAKKIRKWVMSEVLPRIRKTGIYSIAKKYVETNQCVDLYEEFDNGEFKVTSLNNATIEYDEKGKMIRVLDENLKTVWE